MEFNSSSSKVLLTIVPTKKNAFLVANNFFGAVIYTIFIGVFIVPVLIKNFSEIFIIFSLIIFFFTLWGIQFLINRIVFNNIKYTFIMIKLNILMDF